MIYELFNNWIYIISTITFLLIFICFICIDYKNHPYLTIREAIQLVLIFILCFIPIVNSGILVLIFVLALAAGITDLLTWWRDNSFLDKELFKKK